MIHTNAESKKQKQKQRRVDNLKADVEKEKIVCCMQEIATGGF